MVGRVHLKRERRLGVGDSSTRQGIHGLAQCQQTKSIDLPRPRDPELPHVLRTVQPDALVGESGRRVDRQQRSPPSCAISCLLEQLSLCAAERIFSGFELPCRNLQRRRTHCGPVLLDEHQTPVGQDRKNAGCTRMADQFVDGLSSIDLAPPFDEKRDESAFIDKLALDRFWPT